MRFRAPMQTCLMSSVGRRRVAWLAKLDSSHSATSFVVIVSSRILERLEKRNFMGLNLA